MGDDNVITSAENDRYKSVTNCISKHWKMLFLYWITHPWTTEDFIQAHLKAFTFFGGRRPGELIYDQDSILAVSENNGNIIYTAGFQNFIDSMKFDVRVCRSPSSRQKQAAEKAPESPVPCLLLSLSVHPYHDARDFIYLLHPSGDNRSSHRLQLQTLSACNPLP